MSRWWRSQVAIAVPTSAIRPGGRRSRWSACQDPRRM